jgi:phasin family protein
MADTSTTTAAPKADTPAKADAAAPRAIDKAADALPKAAEKAAPAPLKEAAKAAATVAAAPAKVAAATAKAATRAAPATRKAATRSATKKPARAKAAPARRAPAKKSAPRRTSAPAAAAARTAATTTRTTSIAIDINKGTRTMKNEAKQAADRFQAVFGDVNERAKGAFERNARIAEEFSELTKGNVEAFVASTKVTAKAVETIGQEVAEFSRKSFEDASTALKGFADVKSPTDFFRLQSEFARSQFDTVVAETSKLSETVIKFAGQAAEPITSRYSVAAERVRTAVAI